MKNKFYTFWLDMKIWWLKKLIALTNEYWRGKLKILMYLVGSIAVASVIYTDHMSIIWFAMGALFTSRCYFHEYGGKYISESTITKAIDDTYSLFYTLLLIVLFLCVILFFIYAIGWIFNYTLALVT